jgi:4-azaleucine resistance transporter AzlC
VSWSDEFAGGWWAGATLCPAVLTFGAMFGLLSRPAGFDLAGALVMSGTTFAGSAQFAATSVLTAQGGLAAAVIAAVLLNVRYLPIGVSMAPAMTGGWPRRLLEAQLITDESWAISRDSTGRYSRARMLGSGAVLWLAWMLGTAIGYLSHRYVGDPERFGLDLAFPALFVALLPAQLNGPRPRIAAALSAVIVFAVLPFTSAGVATICAFAACAVGWSRKDVKKRPA